MFNRWSKHLFPVGPLGMADEGTIDSMSPDEIISFLSPHSEIIDPSAMSESLDTIDDLNEETGVETETEPELIATADPPEVSTPDSDSATNEIIPEPAPDSEALTTQPDALSELEQAQANYEQSQADIIALRSEISRLASMIPGPVEPSYQEGLADTVPAPVPAAAPVRAAAPTAAAPTYASGPSGYIDFMRGTTADDLFSNPDAMNAFANNIYAAAQESALRNVTRIVSNTVSQELSAQAAADEFYRSYPQLAAVKPYVMHIANEMLGENPSDMDSADFNSRLAANVSNRIRHTTTQAPAGPAGLGSSQALVAHANTPSPAFARSRMVRRQPKPALQGIAAEINEMMEL